MESSATKSESCLPRLVIACFPVPVIDAFVFISWFLIVVFLLFVGSLICASVTHHSGQRAGIFNII